MQRSIGWTGWGAILALSVALLAIYVASPVRTSYDSRWSIHTAMSLLRGQWGELGAYRPILAREHGYGIQEWSDGPRTIYPVGVSILAAPVVAVAAWLDPTLEQGLATRVPDKLERVIASMTAAGSAALFCAMLLRRFGSWATALAGTVAFGLGSPMWSTASRALWQHGPMILFVLAAMALLLRGQDRPASVKWAGAALAAAYLMRPAAAIPVLVFTAFVAWRHRACLPGYLACAAVVGLPWLAFNWLTMGWILPPYYLVATGGDGPAADGLAGVLVSPGRGLFVYAPVLLLAPWGFVLAWTTERACRPLHLAFAACALGGIAVVAQWPIWWGGHCYGPRLLSDVLPYFGFYAGYALHRMLHAGWAPAASAAALIAASLAMNAPGALNGGTLRWNAVPDDVDRNPGRLWDWRSPPFLAPRG